MLVLTGKGIEMTGKTLASLRASPRDDHLPVGSARCAAEGAVDTLAGSMSESDALLSNVPVRGIADFTGFFMKDWI